MTSCLIALPGATPAKASVTGDLQIAMDASGTFIATIQKSDDQVVDYWKDGDMWFGPAGIGGTSRSDSPVAIDASGQMVVFINPSGDVVKDTRNSDGSWTGPTAIGGTAAAGSALAISGNGDVVAFLNSSDEVVADTLSNGTWTGPAATGGTARSGSPIAIDNDATNIYFVDTSNYVTNDWRSGGTWDGPARMGGQAAGGSQMATDPNGNIVAFVNTSGYVVNDWVGTADDWEGPAEMGGTAETDTPLALDGAPTHVYFLNTSGDVENDWVSGGTWEGPAEIGGSAVSGSGLATTTTGPSTVFFLSSTGVSVDWANGGYWHGPAQPDTVPTSIKGVNWPVDDVAVSGGNYQSGPVVIAGLSTSDTPAEAESAAETITSSLYSDTGGNTVRIPINEATVSSSSYWPVYEAAIEGMRTEGNVILTYWAYQNGKPVNMTDYWDMWDTVVSDFSGDANVFFEPINEPYGYSTAADLVDDVYNPWLSNYSSVPRNRVLLDGLGYADNVAAIGALVSGTLLSVHDYPWYSSSATTKSEWESQLSGEIGSYADRTVMTEWGTAMTTGVDYDSACGSAVTCFVQGASEEARELGLGSIYWPGIGTGDTYRMYTLSGTSLTLTNQSGLDQLQNSWGS